MSDSPERSRPLHNDTSLKFSTSAFFQALKEHVSSLEWTLWLRDLRYDKLHEDTYHFYTSSLVKQEKIQETYAPLLKELITCYSSTKNPQVILRTHADTAHEAPTSQVASSASTSSRMPSTPKEAGASDDAPAPSFEHRFETFLVTKATRLAYDSAQKVTRQIGVLSPLYLYGPVGVGKTHLLQAIGHAFQGHFPFLKIRYLDPNAFVSEFTRSIALGTDRHFRLKYKSCDLLLIDDIQFFSGKEKSCLEFFHIFNAIASPQKKQMVFCSDRNPHELDNIHHRLKSRLSGSVIIEIPPLDEEAIYLLLAHYAQQMNVSMEDSVLRFLAQHLSGDVRKIQGAMQTLRLLSDLYQLPVTLELCQQHVKQLRLPPHKSNLSPENILLSLCRYANIPLNDLRSGKRSRSVAQYRQIAMYLLREYTSLSIMEIGSLLGGKTSSTVSIGCKKMRSQYASDPLLQKTIKQILHSI